MKMKGGRPKAIKKPNAAQMPMKMKKGKACK